MNWINSWRKGNKQDDVIELGIRLGRFTVLEFKVDFSSGFGRLIILNFGVSW